MRTEKNQLKKVLNRVIFGTGTPAGKAFDIILMIVILCNSMLIIIESVDAIFTYYEAWITFLGWFFLVTFTLEYLLRIIVVKNKVSYVLSFYGLIDLLAVLPALLGVFLPRLRFIVVVRSLRMLRLFSILKMGRYIDESSHLVRALRASIPKIIVFLFTILFIVVIVGTMMYVIEGPESGFNNIPESMYWAVVTVSTVGYGDISPQTATGKLVASLLMILGYGIIAVPTGIISHELAHSSKFSVLSKKCPNCYWESYAQDDQFCPKCGALLES